MILEICIYPTPKGVGFFLPDKDRDCHFYVETVWSYGGKPKYRAQHHGYCHPQFNEEFASYAEAVRWLADKLEKMVKLEESCQPLEQN